ncbi:hypothetical protein GCM10027569_72030 [Flindersiella endophytica]
MDWQLVIRWRSEGPKAASRTTPAGLRRVEQGARTGYQARRPPKPGATAGDTGISTASNFLAWSQAGASERG